MTCSTGVCGFLHSHFKSPYGCLFSVLYVSSLFVSSSSGQRRRQISEFSRPDDNYFDESLWKNDDFAIVGDTSTIWQDGCKPVLIRDDLCNARCGKKYIFSRYMGARPRFSWENDAQYLYFYVRFKTYDRCLRMCAHNTFDPTYKKEVCTGVIYHFEIDSPQDIYQAHRCMVLINFAWNDRKLISSGMPDLPYNRLTPCEAITCQRHQPCFNNGTCTDTVTNVNGYTCLCPFGYIGFNCEVKTACVSRPCQNGGSCKPKPQDGYVCVCSNGYIGSNCKVFNNCTIENFCNAHGTCFFYENDDGRITFNCRCEDGFLGTHCEIENKCKRANPCLNHGRCTVNELNKFVPECACDGKYLGTYCEFENKCMTSFPCKNDGICRTVKSSDTYVFQCDCGRKFLGNSCQFENKCITSNPCSSHGICRPVNSSTGYTFECECAKTYVGTFCEFENKCTTANPCKNQGICKPNKSSGAYTFDCTCGQNFLGSSCEYTNVCTNANPCLNNALCKAILVDKKYNFVCECKEGYFLDKCQLADPCIIEKPCVNNGVCRSQLNNALSTFNYSCTCAQGFYGRNCNFVNSCLLNNPCSTLGSCEQIDNAGQFKCSCIDGFYGKLCNNSWYDAIASTYYNFVARVIDKSDFEQLGEYIRDSMSSNVKQNMCQLKWWCLNGGTCVPSMQKPMGFYCACPSTAYGYNCQIQCPGDAWTVNYFKYVKDGAKFVNTSGTLSSCQQACVSDSRCLAIAYLTDRPDRNCYTYNKLSDASQYNTSLLLVLTRCLDAKAGACTSAPCNNGGECHVVTDDPYGYVCKCTSASSYGKNCQISDKCLTSNPCSNGGTCSTSKSANSDFTCTCAPGFEGKQCKDAIVCRCNPCTNGGVCVADYSNNKGYICNCARGFDGKNCESEWLTKISSAFSKFKAPRGSYAERWQALMEFGQGMSSEIRERLCLVFPCMNQGMCVKKADKPLGFTCTCPTNFHGPLCEYDMRKYICLFRPCQNDALCSVASNKVGYTCVCNPTYSGDQCQYREPCSYLPCFNGGTCAADVTIKKGYRCICPKQFNGDDCENLTIRSLVDLSMTNAELSMGSMDMSKIQSTVCAGITCMNGAVCVVDLDKTDAFSCQCRNGFIGDRCETKTKCADNPCQHGGLCHATSSTSQVICDCPSKYTGSTCQYDNPCLINACQNGAICEPTADYRSYTCHCVEGFSGTSCEITKSCLQKPCQNDGTCFRSRTDANDYECHCTRDWAGKNCLDIKVCMGRPCMNGATCSMNNDNWQTYNCHCPPRYEGKACEFEKKKAVLFCASSPCKNRGSCDESSSKCICSAHFSGLFCQNKAVCASEPCFNGATCESATSNVRTFTCRCAAGFVGKLCENEQTGKMRQAMYQGMSMKRYRSNDADNDHASQVEVDVGEVIGARQTRNMANIERVSWEDWRRDKPLDEEKKNEEIGPRFDSRYRKQDDDDNTEFGAKDRRANFKQDVQRSFRSNLDHSRTHVRSDADHSIISRHDNDEDGIQIVYVGDDERIYRRKG